MSMSERTILCVDMDAFFASVEQAINPSLKGKPIGIIGAKERSVIVTSSYEARKKGVKTGMNKFTALKLCPELILIEAKGRRYTSISTQIGEILQSITPESAMYSIDEAFLDITGTGLSPESAAYMIKSLIRSSLGIGCTVGGGPNRLIAKMATHINKPDGYYFVHGDKIIPFIDSFKLSEIWGIGRHYAKRFNSMGIFTPSDIRGFGEESLENIFGIPGKILYKLVSGESEASIPKHDPNMKSVGHSMTMDRDISEKEYIFAYLLQLSHMVSSRARKHNYFGKTIVLTVRFPDMSTISFRTTFPFHTSSTHHIYEAVCKLYDLHIPIGATVRLLGVTLGNIGKYGVKLSCIEDFTNIKNDKWKNVYAALDNINAKFGDKTIFYASTLQCQKRGSTVIPPSWQTDGCRNISIDDN